MTSFFVRVPALEKDRVFIVGLGAEEEKWLPENAQELQLIKQEADSQTWYGSFNLNEDSTFRFFIGQRIGPHTVVRSWEAYIHPRTVSQGCGSEESSLTYGTYGGHTLIQKGFLTCQSEIHLRLHSKPLKIKSRGPHYIYCSPINDDDESASDVFVSSLSSSDPRQKKQPDKGTECGDTDYITFSMQTCNYSSTPFLFKILDASANLIATSSLPPLIDNCGVTRQSVISIDGKYIGSLQVDYLMIHPFKTKLNNLSKSYASHWKDRAVPYHIGHRGSGNSFNDVPAKVRENTLESLQYAGDHGADFVEFDVHLSQDRVPVVYHDFNTCVLALKAGLDKKEWVPVPIHTLSTSQMNTLQFAHMSQLGKTPFVDDTISPKLRQFTTLEQFLQDIDPLTGFNVEVKYCCRELSGNYEEGLSFFEERNTYIDSILDVLLNHGKHRRIILSCFDADVCTMLTLKQCLYPVFFLNQGKTERYKPYLDSRSNCSWLGAQFCLSQGVQGLDAHAEDLIRDPSLIGKIKAKGLRVFSWGNDNNVEELRQLQINSGVDAIIYDKIYENRVGNIFKNGNRTST